MSPQDLARATAGPLPRLTPRTITDPAALLEELDQVRAEGVAYDREENSEGICAVGMSCAGSGPWPSSVPLPAQRFYGREPLLREALLGRAARVEHALGAAVAQSGRPPGSGSAVRRPRAVPTPGSP